MYLYRTQVGTRIINYIGGKYKRTLKVPQNRKDTRTIINAASVDNLVILLEGYSENSLSTPREYFLLGFEDKIKYNDNEQVVEDLHKIRDNWNNGEDPEKRQKRIEYLVNLRSLNFAQSIIENVNRGHKIVQLVGAYHVPFIERHLKKNNVSYLSFIQDQKTNAQNKMVNLNHL